MKLTDKEVTALKRKRGELNLTVKELAQSLNLSRWTVARIIKDDDRNFTPTTIRTVKDWLLDQYIKN